MLADWEYRQVVLHRGRVSCVLPLRKVVSPTVVLVFGIVNSVKFAGSELSALGIVDFWRRSVTELS